jgi:hypothetical protein
MHFILKQVQELISLLSKKSEKTYLWNKEGDQLDQPE